MRVADKWKELGIELLSNEGGHSMLQIIAVDHPHDVVSCCKRLFEYWLQTTVDATWNQLIRTLRSPCVQLDYLADQLEQMMSTECKIYGNSYKFLSSLACIIYAKQKQPGCKKCEANQKPQWL